MAKENEPTSIQLLSKSSWPWFTTVGYYPHYVTFGLLTKTTNNEWNKFRADHVSFILKLEET